LSRDAVERRLAVLIMSVTLVGASIPFLQVRAGNREATADREAQAASVGAMSAVVEANRSFARQGFAADAESDQKLFGEAYEADRGPARPYALALAGGYRAAAATAGGHMRSLFKGRYDLPGGRFDVLRFYEEELRNGYRNSELQKAYARERDGWGSKGKRLLTVITTFALAVFLLGLALTVPGGAQRLFVWSGCTVATGATAWALIVWLQPVEGPSGRAIEAFVEGQAKADVTDFLVNNPGVRARNFELIAADFDRAIAARDDYQEAYLGRGTARFALDLERRPGGPQGSEAARADFERAAELDRNSFIAWGNLGAAEFWLGDYDAALDSTAESLRLQPDDVIFNLNRALYLIVSRREEEYRAQLPTVRRVVAEAPAWLRDFAMARYDLVIDQGIAYRPNVAPQIAMLRQDLREVYASVRTHGEPEPVPVEAELEPGSFKLSEPGEATASGLPRLAFRAGVANRPGSTFGPPGADALVRLGTVTRERLLRAYVTFDHVGADDRWLFDTYVNGARVRDLSLEAERWRFGTPSGRFVIELPGAGKLYPPGSQVRTEIFVGGNLLAAIEYRYARP
jgi:tetratricopeptide (TPR) repeat protein